MKIVLTIALITVIYFIIGIFITGIMDELDDSIFENASDIALAALFWPVPFIVLILGPLIKLIFKSGKFIVKKIRKKRQK